MTDGHSYSGPAAFRRALTDRLKAKAKTDRWSVPQLQRQFAYDRLLERLYLLDRCWILKGAAALLARDIGVRGSLDIDVYRAKAPEVAEEELRDAASRDLGDWFRFEIGPGRSVGDGAVGVRLPVAAYVGATVWQEFNVDLVGTDLAMTGEPDDVPLMARVQIPDVEQHGYRAYPLVDHIADKVAATLERHGAGQNVSTRFRDLVDLVAIVTSASVAADAQSEALASEAQRRGLTSPMQFAVPDRALWNAAKCDKAGRCPWRNGVG